MRALQDVRELAARPRQPMPSVTDADSDTISLIYSGSSTGAAQLCKTFAYWFATGVLTRHKIN